MPPRRSSSRKANKPKSRAAWVRAPATVAPGETIRREVEARAQELINTVFKPKHVRATPEHPDWNHLTDIVGRWQRGFFYFVSVYACPGPNALSPTFEAPLMRLRHVAGGTFDLGYLRHTEQWWELYHGLTLDEAFKTIREQMHFWPVS